MSITSFKYLVDSKNKNSPHEDYFNFTHPDLYLSNVQACKIETVQIPYTWKNFRQGINDEFKISLKIGSVTYDLTFNLRESFLKEQRNLQDLLTELNAVFVANIQAKLTAAGYGGTPHYLVFLNVGTQGLGNSRLELTFSAGTAWGNTTANAADTTSPRIVKIENVLLSRMLGLTNMIGGRDFRKEINTGTYSTVVSYEELPNITPDTVYLSSNYLTKYQSSNNHVNSNVVATLPIGYNEFRTQMVWNNIRSFHNHHPVGGHGGNLDFQLSDNYGPIHSYSAQSRLQVILEFFENPLESRD